MSRRGMLTAVALMAAGAIGVAPDPASTSSLMIMPRTPRSIGSEPLHNPPGSTREKHGGGMRDERRARRQKAMRLRTRRGRT